MQGLVVLGSVVLMRGYKSEESEEAEDWDMKKSNMNFSLRRGWWWLVVVRIYAVQTAASISCWQIDWT